MTQLPRFYVDSVLANGLEIDLPDPVAHHALRVLRLTDGDAVTVFNGQGGEFEGTLQVSSNVRHASFLPIQQHLREVELDYPVHVGQGICAGDKMDWLIEKCVELGVAKLTPLALQKCVARVTGERQEKRLSHWRQIVTAASEQCGRNRLMQIDAPLDLDGFAKASASAAYRLVLSPEQSVPLDHFAAHHVAAPVAVLIGPEAGLAPLELERAIDAGFTPISLGPRILRTETAALAALAALNALWSSRQL
jgi:16S rRNA (uracil1498-N3)-methyltransferase